MGLQRDRIASNNLKKNNLEQKSNISTSTGYRFDHMVTASPVAVYSCDKDGYINFFNDAAVELWGRAPEAGKDQWCGSWKIFSPDGKPMEIDKFPLAVYLKEGKAIKGEEIIIERPDNTFRTLRVFPCPIIENEEVVGAYNTLVDVTQLMPDLEKQSMLAAIVESSDDAIISKTLEGIITSWNKGAERIFGYTESEILGENIQILIPDALLHEENEMISSISNGGKIDHFDTYRIAKNGAKIPVSLTVSPIKDQKGMIIGASKIARDISEQINKEKALQQSTQRLKILNSVGKIISEKLDIKTILQRVIDASTRITGASHGIFIYNTLEAPEKSSLRFTYSGLTEDEFQILYDQCGEDFFISLLEKKDVLRITNFEKDPRLDEVTVSNSKALSIIPTASYMAVPVVIGSGESIGRMCLSHHEPNMFTETHEELAVNIGRQAAVALDHARLFEEIQAMNDRKDEFIAMAGHELRTPLTSAKGYLQMLEMLEKDNMSKSFIEKSLIQLEKLKVLIDDLLDISQMEAGQLHLDIAPFDLRQLILEVTENMRYSQKTHAIIVESDKLQLPVKADRRRIEQVLINLLTNAVKYSPDAEEVRVILEKSADKVVVIVKDFGIGLNREKRQNLFKRFYRAEKDSRVSGMGLGLYLTRNILELHKQEIHVHSEPGKGSEFSFSLPLSE